MTIEEITKLLADDNADNGERMDAIEDVGRQRLSQFKDQVIAFLTHPNSDYRGAAIVSLVLFWNLPEFVPTAIDMLERDPEMEVRGSAVHSLNAYSEIQTDQRELLIHAFARAVAMQTDDDVRKQAYFSLLYLTGQRPLHREIADGFIEKTTRWSLVNPHLPPELQRQELPQKPDIESPLGTTNEELLDDLIDSAPEYRGKTR